MNYNDLWGGFKSVQERRRYLVKIPPAGFPELHPTLVSAQMNPERYLGRQLLLGIVLYLSSPRIQR